MYPVSVTTEIPSLASITRKSPGSAPRRVAAPDAMRYRLWPTTAYSVSLTWNSARPTVVSPEFVGVQTVESPGAPKSSTGVLPVDTWAYTFTSREGLRPGSEYDAVGRRTSASQSGRYR